MSKELIKTDTLWYKIKKFFKGIFSKNNNVMEESHYAEIDEDKNDFSQNIFLDKNVEEEIKRITLANNLMNKKVNIESLSEKQVSEMIVYFENYINSMDRQLNEIKEDIIKIKRDNI